jgi:hypothetical protein
MDSILSSLTLEQLRMVEDQLSNSESSTAAELRAHFVMCGLTAEQADRALSYRHLYVSRDYLEGHTPILKGDSAIQFDPNRRPLDFIQR